MARNDRAAADARNARTGKDVLIYDGDGKMFASVDQFQSKASFNNAKYTPLGDPQEHETELSYGITITFSEIVIEDIDIFRQVMEALRTGVTPQLQMQGSIQGLNGSDERIFYPDCIPSGDIDLQNIENGDVIKRSWSLFCNGKPQLMSELSI